MKKYKMYVKNQCHDCIGCDKQTENKNSHTAEQISYANESQKPSTNDTNDETMRRIVEHAIDKICGGADIIDTIRGLFPNLYITKPHT